MRLVVFLVLLAYAAAEQGYNYEPSQGYETPAVHDDFEQHADYHKHFFAFEAPQDAGEQADLAEQSIAAIAKKNLQVVFIKAPENKGVEGALNALIKQSNVDKTAIYVLNKQTDTQELASKFNALQSQHKHKPQVHFVKYRTEAEAAHAQQQIRAKYEAATPQSLEQSQLELAGYNLPPPPGALNAATTAQSLDQSHLLAAFYAQKQQQLSAGLEQTYSGPLAPVNAATAAQSLDQSQLLAAYYAQQLQQKQQLEQTFAGPLAPVNAPTTAESVDQSQLLAAYYAQQQQQQQLAGQTYAGPLNPSKLLAGSAQAQLSSLGSFEQSAGLSHTYLPPVGALPAEQQTLEPYAIPLAQQQLQPSAFDLDARSARRSRRIDFRVNERQRGGSRMIFPSA